MKKLLFFFVVILLSARSIQASTTVSNNIIFNTTWTKVGSPYIVTQSIDIYETGPDGLPVTLTINPGVVVKFAKDATLTVRGILAAMGTADEMITFTWNELYPPPREWGGIVFANTAMGTVSDPAGNYKSGSIIKYCEVSHGQGIQNPNPIELWIMNNRIIDNSISNNSFPDSSAGAGIYNAGNSKITGNTISGNTSYAITTDAYSHNYSYAAGGGIYNTGNSTITGNTIYYNTSSAGGSDYAGNSFRSYAGGGIYNTGNSTITGNSIYYNTSSAGSGCAGGGIYNTGNSMITGNTIYGNNSSSNSFFSDCSGGGINNTGDATIIGNTISDNTSYSDTSAGGGIYNAGDSTISGNSIFGNTAYSYHANSNSSSGGGICNKVASTITSNAISNNTSAYDYGSDSGGIYNTGASVISDNSIRYNFGDGLFTGISTITGNIIYNNTGIGISAASATIENNLVKGNSNGGIYNWGTSVITGNLIKSNGSSSGNALFNFNSGVSAIDNNSIICNATQYGIASGPLSSFTGNNLVNPNAAYEFYYSGSSNLAAPNNYWGTTNPMDLFNRIYDYWHDVSLGKVNYTPLAVTPFNGISADGGCADKADFAAIPLQGAAPLLVSFVDLSSDNPTSWQWTFGDGGTAALQDPAHVYKNPGTYTVALSIVGNNGQESLTKTGYITANPCSNSKVMIAGQPYNSIQAAYEQAASGALIKALAVDFAESLTFGDPKVVTLTGGFACDYSPWQIGNTYVSSPVTISDGTIIFDRIVIL